MKPDLQTVQDLGSPNIKECPYCGCEEYIFMQKISGSGRYFLRYDGKVAENGEMYEGLKHIYIGKFAYCAECDKRVFRFKD